LTDNDGTTDVASQTVNVYDPGRAITDFTYTPRHPQVGDEVEFDSLSGSTGTASQIVDWLWTFSDGGSSAHSPTAYHTFTATGYYQAKLTIVDSYGNQDSISTTIYVADIPSAPRVTVTNNASGDTIVAPGSIATLYGKSGVSPRIKSTIAAKLVGGIYTLPTSYQGIEVDVNGVPSPLFYVSADQINFQIPLGTKLGTARIQVWVDGSLTAEQNDASVFDTALGMYTSFDSATKRNDFLNAVVIYYNSDYSRASGPSYTVNQKDVSKLNTISI
jgi:PKD repeat protein